MSFDVFWSSLLEMLGGVPVSLELSAISLSCGFFLAIMVAGMRLSNVVWARRAAQAYVYVLRGTPLILQIFFVYYGLGQLEFIRESWVWYFFREAMFCAIFGLTLNTSAYGSEIIRAGLQSVSPGFIEAATALGMTRWQRLRLIVFPLALRQMLPAYGNELVAMIKGTAIASTITIMEITGIAREIVSETYQPIEVFLAAGVIYLALTASLTALIRWLEFHLSKQGTMN